MTTIKQNILSKFGGASVVASICGVSPAAVSQWEDIPGKYHKTLYMKGRELGINIIWEEFHFTPDELVDLRLSNLPKSHCQEINEN